MSPKYVHENAGSGFAVPDDDDELASFFNVDSEDGSTDEDTSLFFTAPNAGLEDEEVDASIDGGDQGAFAAVDDDSDPFDVAVEDESVADDDGMNDFDSLDAEFEQPVVESSPEPELPQQPEEPVYEPEPAPELQQPVVQSRWATQPTFTPDPEPEPVYESAPEPVQEAPAPEPVFEEPEPVVAPEQTPSYTSESDQFTTRRSMRESEESYQQPEPVYEETPVQRNSARRINIPSESDRIEEVNRIVQVLDVYRGLSPTEMRDSVYSLMTLSPEEPESEAQVIVKALNANALLFKTIRALREAKNTDPVERVFYILELQEDVFYNLGNMAIVFTDDDPLDESQTKTNFARQLVKIIDSLEDEVMAVVSNTEDVLQAAVGDE